MLNKFFSFENRAGYEIMRKNIVQPDRPQMVTWRIHVACCIFKAINPHPEYVVLIAFSNLTVVTRTCLIVMLYVYITFRV